MCETLLQNEQKHSNIFSNTDTAFCFFFKERIVRLNRVKREQERGKYLTIFIHDLSHYNAFWSYENE